MATVEDCDRALRDLAERLAGVDEQTRKKHVVERSLSCWVRDLDVVFTAELTGSGLTGLRRHEGGQQSDAQIRLAAESDDLVALCHGDLGVAGAWSSGRLKIDASVLDVLRLRTLL